MNKLALGIDLSSQIALSKDKAGLVSTISSLETGGNKFSAMLAKQHDKASAVDNRESRTRTTDRPAKSENRQKNAERNDTSDRRAERKEAESSKGVDSRADTNGSESVRSSNDVSETEDKRAPSDDSGRRDSEDKASRADSDTKGSEEPDETLAESVVDAENVVVAEDEVVESSIDLSALQEGLVNLDGIAETMTGIAVLDEAATTVEGSVKGAIAGLDSVESDLVAAVPLSEAGGEPLPVVGGIDGLDVQGEVGEIGLASLSTDSDDVVAGVESKIPPSETISVASPIDISGKSQAAQSAIATPMASVLAADGMDTVDGDVLGNRAIVGDAKSGGNALTGSMLGANAGGAGGGSAEGDAGKNNGNAMLLKGLENAALKSATAGDKAIISDKFGSMLSQQLEGVDSRMTSSTMDGRVSLSQLREVPGLRTYTTSVPLPMNNAEWGEEFSEKVTWLVNQKIQSAEVHINPQELGPIEIKINMQNDQANVVINSQHSTVRDLLELNVHRLRDMMDGAGVDLGDVNVSDQSPQQEAESQQGHQAGDESGELNGNGGDEHSETETASIRVGPVNLVDYYA